jgi:hypothetical protein
LIILDTVTTTFGRGDRLQSRDMQR